MVEEEAGESFWEGSEEDTNGRSDIQDQSQMHLTIISSFLRLILEAAPWSTFQHVRLIQNFSSSSHHLQKFLHTIW